MTTYAATTPAASVWSRAWAAVRYHALTVYAALAFIYLLLPIAVVIAFSFNDPAGRFNYTWQGFTLDNWKNWDAVPGLVGAMGLSLQIAALSSIIATVLGTLIGLALVRHDFRGRGSTNLLIFLPMSTPEIVLGASLLTLFLTMQVATGFMTILIAHIMFNISLRRRDREGPARGLRPTSRRGRGRPRRERVDDVPQGDAAADRAGDSRRRCCSRSRCRSTTS